MWKRCGSLASIAVCLSVYTKTISDVLGIMQTSAVDLSKMALVTVWHAFRYGG